MNNNESEFLRRTIELARQSVQKGGFPAGAIVVKDGEIIAEGISIGGVLNDPTSHAETASIREACQKLQTTDLQGAVLYESIQSCLMCFSVTYWVGISKIVYACRKTPEMVDKFYYEGSTDTAQVNKQNNRNIELVFLPGFEEESLEVIKQWEKVNG